MRIRRAQVLVFVVTILGSALNAGAALANFPIHYKSLEQCYEKKYTSEATCRESYDAALANAQGDVDRLAQDGFDAPMIRSSPLRTATKDHGDSDRRGQKFVPLTYKSLVQCLDLAKAPAKSCRSAYARALAASAKAHGHYESAEECMAAKVACDEIPSMYFQPKIVQFPAYSQSHGTRKSCESRWPGLSCIEGRNEQDIEGFHAVFRTVDDIPRYPEIDICEDDFGEGKCDEVHGAPTLVRTPVSFVVSARPKLVVASLSPAGVIFMVLGFVVAVLVFCFKAAQDSQFSTSSYASSSATRRIATPAAPPPELVLPGTERRAAELTEGAVRMPAGRSVAPDGQSVIATSKTQESTIVKNKRKLFLDD